jgi:hypothetical protein
MWRIAGSFGLGKLLLAFASTVILLFGSRANINGSAIFY